MVTLLLIVFANSPGQVEEMFSPQLDCGSRCLYCYLKLVDKPVKYRQVREAVGDAGLQGVSLIELKDAAGRLGTGLRIAKFRLAAIHSIREPAIVLQNPAPGFQTGHFVVVAPSGKGVFYIDPVSGQRLPVANDQSFVKRFSGYLLCRRPALQINGILLAAGSAMLLLTVLYTLRCRKKGSV